MTEACVNGLSGGWKYRPKTRGFYTPTTALAFILRRGVEQGESSPVTPNDHERPTFPIHYLQSDRYARPSPHHSQPPRTTRPSPLQNSSPRTA
ncbi:hypothetical protein JAAARDRAFT_300931 [Jaapia argillacea MUCL 33604]|uniref:Uncharacterized protein n=1 Tax=Jaapia argillacea MUCL 33604 TaxID=933084 RepID=A0A067PPQ6_9AGAM|nr:hypothetical protein JAAARDRAFT_300931 [Jaapia argillacea MUCL 33604]